MVRVSAQESCGADGFSAATLPRPVGGRGDGVVSGDVVKPEQRKPLEVPDDGSVFSSEFHQARALPTVYHADGG